MAGPAVPTGCVPPYAFGGGGTPGCVACCGCCSPECCAEATVSFNIAPPDPIGDCTYDGTPTPIDVDVIVTPAPQDGICCIEFLNGGTEMRAVGTGMVQAVLDANADGVIGTCGDCVGEMPRQWEVVLPAFTGGGCCDDVGDRTILLSYMGNCEWRSGGFLTCMGIITYSFYYESPKWYFKVEIPSAMEVTYEWDSISCCGSNLSSVKTTETGCTGPTFVTLTAVGDCPPPQEPFGALTVLINGDHSPLWVTDGTPLTITMLCEKSPDCAVITQTSLTNPCNLTFRIASLRNNNRIILNRRKIVKKLYEERAKRMRQLRSSPS